MPALRVLYSFPHRIGAGRICYTAWHQVAGASAAGADVTVFPVSVHRQLPDRAQSIPTLARGSFRLPFRIVGDMRAFALHDRIVARRLPAIAKDVDIVHTWPLGALETLRTAKQLGIPTVLERPNAHTRFAYGAVAAECNRLGLALPRDHEHAYNGAVLDKEEAEYDLADRILCPSEFVVDTFLNQGFTRDRLVRHIYGYDERTFHPKGDRLQSRGRLTVLFVGVAAVRKGLHFALEAWLRSGASDSGRFLIAGEILPSYGRVLEDELAHPSVHVLGHRSDVADLMRESDVLVLPSIEEGFGLVCAEAMGSGTVPLVSEACTDTCQHMGNALVHPVGDVATLEQHLTALHEDQDLLESLRTGCLRTAPTVTWSAAGRRLVEAYHEALAKTTRVGETANLAGMV